MFLLRSGGRRILSKRPDQASCALVFLQIEKWRWARFFILMFSFMDFLPTSPFYQFPVGINRHRTAFRRSVDGKVEVGRRSHWIGILSRPSHGSYSLSPGDGLANPHKDFLEMGIVVISALDRFIDPDGVTASNRTR